LIKGLERITAELRAWKHFIKFWRPGGAPLWPAETINLEPSSHERGRLRSVGGDPQVRLAGLPRTHLQFGPAIIEIALRVESGLLAHPFLYLDRGCGFNEADKIPLLPAEAERLVGVVPSLRGARTLRFDPSEGPVDITLGEIRLRRSRAGETDLALTTDGRPGSGWRRRPRWFGSHSPLLPHLRLDGVEVVAVRAIEATDEAGVFVLTDGDPQVILRAVPEHAKAQACRYTFEIEEVEGVVAAPRLYIDYDGKGFSQDASFALARQPDGLYHALVARPDLKPTVRWDPSDRRGKVRLVSVSVQPEDVSALSDPAETDVESPPDDMAASLSERRAQAVVRSFELNELRYNSAAALAYDYGRWIKATEQPSQADRLRMPDIIAAMDWRPRFSFVMPTYNTPPDLLETCIQSMLDQVYPDFEICIADDHSSDPRVRTLLEALAARYPQIRVTYRETNGHISEASNSALALATGDFVVLVDHDDILPDYALLVVADALNRNPGTRILYSDEDKLAPSGQRCDPYFKSDFNRFLMFGHNMVSHLGVYQRTLLETIGGFRKGYEGSQDYDLFLRCLDHCSDSEIVHIPHVLYHWRMIPGSTAVSADQKSYAIVAAQKSINDFMRRNQLPFEVVDGVAPGLTRLAVVGDPERRTVSIVIPTRDGLDLLRPCLESLRGSIDDAVEVVIVDNDSVEPETHAYLAELALEPGFKVVAAPGAFNFSAICNLGVAASSGEIICLLNNDTELETQDWLTRARALLSMPDVGIVGARLIYPDRSIQHFGLYLGMGAHGVAGTPHRGLPMSDFGPFGKARLIQEFSAVTAACLFVKRPLYEAVGGLDPELRVAYNDVDFCLKVRALGKKILCDPDIVLIHKESKTRGADTDNLKAERLEMEARTMRARWNKQLANDPYYNPNLTLDRDDFSLADAPRSPLPWRRTEANTARMRQS